ncbi:hypothetical protein JCM19045_4929 [Bacillus sp. JCM 19045]|nr:hypothetical protein JCM19045_4929 [Bacillus sp. JCM 19045]
MKLAQITIIALVLFISGCSSNQNSFEEQRDEWPELAVVEAEIGSDWDNVSVENDQAIVVFFCMRQMETLCTNPFMS